MSSLYSSFDHEMGLAAGKNRSIWANNATTLLRGMGISLYARAFSVTSANILAVGAHPVFRITVHILLKVYNKNNYMADKKNIKIFKRMSAYGQYIGGCNGECSGRERNAQTPGKSCGIVGPNATILPSGQRHLAMGH